MGIEKGLTHGPEEMSELKDIVLNKKFNPVNRILTPWTIHLPEINLLAIKGLTWIGLWSHDMFAKSFWFFSVNCFFPIRLFFTLNIKYL